jgi:hypothetical protein
MPWRLSLPSVTPEGLSIARGPFFVLHGISVLF